MRSIVVGIEFRYTEHLEDKLRAIYPMAEPRRVLHKALTEGYLVQRHTSALAIILNDYKRAKYVWCKSLDLVLVISEEESIITAYTASESNWVQIYLSRVPRKQRIRFQDCLGTIQHKGGQNA
jgi:hypothetical protein